MSPAETGIRAALLSWFDGAARDLPWRGCDDPYAVLVSEVMSQQTRIETVRGYWTRWMVEFPTLSALAEADSDHVMRMWAGLGYYRRARNLHACARVVAAGSGALPTTAAELAALPGIGGYTSAAVASISFGEVVAAIDGNVSRVMARLYAIEGDPGRAAFRHAVAERAAPLIDPLRAGDSNEALMELGATVCTPRNPSCDRCPVAAWCEARANGDPTRYPAPQVRKPPRRETRCSVVAIREDGSVFVRRGTEALLEGLWEFPTYDATVGEAVSRVRDEHGLWGAHERVGEVEHVFSHIRMTYHVVRLRVGSGASPEGGRWLSADTLVDEGLSVAMRRVAAQLLDHGQAMSNRSDSVP